MYKEGTKIVKDTLGLFIPKKKSKPKHINTVPGTPIYTGEEQDREIKMNALYYNQEIVEEQLDIDYRNLSKLIFNRAVTWIDIDGLHKSDILQHVANTVGLHPLIVEDIVSIEQRPKFEMFDNYIFFTLKMLTYNEKSSQIDIEQVSIILGDGFVISLQEKPGDVFGNIRHRIKTGLGRVRKKGADYLAYILVDAIVDNYYIIIDRLEDRINTLESELLQDIDAVSLAEIQSLKKDLYVLYKNIYPLREAVGKLSKFQSKLLDKKNNPFYDDLYDHTIQVIESLDLFKNQQITLRETYVSTMDHKMTKVMNLLTLISTIFLPLTFIVGVYGMNFEYMPELQMRYGYHTVWAIMIALAGTMIFIFKRKKWL